MFMPFLLYSIPFTPALPTTKSIINASYRLELYFKLESISEYDMKDIFLYSSIHENRKNDIVVVVSVTCGKVLEFAFLSRSLLSRTFCCITIRNSHVLDVKETSFLRKAFVYCWNHPITSSTYHFAHSNSKYFPPPATDLFTTKFYYFNHA